MLNIKISNTIRKSAHTLLETKIMISVIMLAILTVSSLTYLPVQAPASTSPTYGTATVDGVYTEWNLTNDFFANMSEAGDPGKDHLATAYLRYDCDANVMYVLVLADGLATYVDVSKDDAWVRLNCDGERAAPVDFIAFEWVPPSPTGNTTDGWEASFDLLEGCHTLNIHTNIDGRTSEFAGGCADLFICCPGATTTETSTTTDTSTSTETSTFTDCTTTDTTTTETETSTETSTTTSITTSTFTDCTDTTTTATTTSITTITTSEDCYLGDGGVSYFGTIQCEGPNVIVGETEVPEIWRGAAGTVPADWIDATSAALAWGLCFDGVLYWDHDGNETNQATGQTILPGHEIMSGGPLVNAPVKYYEGAKLAPVYFKVFAGLPTFFSTEGTTDTTDDIPIVTSQLAWDDIGPGLDMFVVELFEKPGTSGDPEYAFIAYGYSGRGTLASSVYLKTVIEPDLSSYTRDYYVVKWEDTNGNGHPDIPGTDTYTPVTPSP